jgi:maleylpyruvate isomerase
MMSSIEATWKLMCASPVSSSDTANLWCTGAFDEGDAVVPVVRPQVCGAVLLLARWARTGEETPMYPLPGQRDADIQAGVRRKSAELRQWAERSATRLSQALAALTDEQWARPVRTAQGRTVGDGTPLAARTGGDGARRRPRLARLVRRPARRLPRALVDDIVAKRSAGN